MIPHTPSHYRQPHFQPVCARCGVHPGDTPFFSPQGHTLCRVCFNAGAVQAADQRAAATPAFGGGLINLGHNEQGALAAGMQTDLEAKMLRRCAKCKAHAVTVVHVTFHYVNGLTRGRTYEHRCGACNATFKTESVLRMLSELFTGIVCALVGAGTIAVGPSGWGWVLALCLPLGLWVTWLTVARTVARLRNPIVPRVV